jgi:hypothetical protein
MTVWRLKHYGLDADTVARLLRTDYSSSVHITSEQLPKAARTAFALQNSLNAYYFRRYGDRNPGNIISGYIMRREPCPSRQKCNWTPTVVLAGTHEGDGGGNALFVSRKTCSTCYKVITSAGGALDAYYIQKLGIDATTARALFAPGPDDTVP